MSISQEQDIGKQKKWDRQEKTQRKASKNRVTAVDSAALQLTAFSSPNNSSSYTETLGACTPERRIWIRGLSSQQRTRSCSANERFPRPSKYGVCGLSYRRDSEEGAKAKPLGGGVCSGEAPINSSPRLAAPPPTEWGTGFRQGWTGGGGLWRRMPPSSQSILFVNFTAPLVALRSERASPPATRVAGRTKPIIARTPPWEWPVGDGLLGSGEQAGPLGYPVRSVVVFSQNVILFFQVN